MDASLYLILDRVWNSCHRVGIEIEERELVGGEKMSVRETDRQKGSQMKMSSWKGEIFTVV